MTWHPSGTASNCRESSPGHRPSADSTRSSCTQDQTCKRTPSSTITFVPRRTAATRSWGPAGEHKTLFPLPLSFPSPSPPLPLSFFSFAFSDTHARMTQPFLSVPSSLSLLPLLLPLPPSSPFLSFPLLSSPFLAHTQDGPGPQALRGGCRVAGERDRRAACGGLFCHSPNSRRANVLCYPDDCRERR